jgi:site-specific DNA-cytosine methylase
LNETIAKNKLEEGEIKILDTYNKTIHDECPTLKKHHAENGDRKLWDGTKIRRLTPRECFRLMDFPDSFTWPVSDSQAYKQAGNSIVVNVLYKILKNLNIK